MMSLIGRSGRVARLMQRVGYPSVAIATFGIQPHGCQGLVVHLHSIECLSIRGGVHSVLRVRPYLVEDPIADPSYLSPEVPFGDAEVLARLEDDLPKLVLEDSAEDFVAHLLQAVGQYDGARVETYVKPPPPQPFAVNPRAAPVAEQQTNRASGLKYRDAVLQVPLQPDAVLHHQSEEAWEGNGRVLGNEPERGFARRADAAGTRECFDEFGGDWPAGNGGFCVEGATDYRQLVTPCVPTDVLPQHGGEVAALGRSRSGIRLVRVHLEVDARHLADRDENSGELRLPTQDCPDQARKLRSVVGRVWGYGADRRGHLAVDRGFHGEPPAPYARHHGPKRGGCAAGEGSALDRYDDLLGNLDPVDFGHDVL